MRNASLDLKDCEGKVESEEEFLFDDDLLKELPFFQDQPAEAEPGESTAKAQVEPDARGTCSRALCGYRR